jgi:hypothetical protein
MMKLAFRMQRMILLVRRLMKTLGTSKRGIQSLRSLREQTDTLHQLIILLRTILTTEMGDSGTFCVAFGPLPGGVVPLAR